MSSDPEFRSHGPADSDEEFLWLRERIDDEEIASLFSDDPQVIEATVRHLIPRARDDWTVERRLLDALELAAEEGCDETFASAWIAIILGEARSVRAIDLLSRCLLADDESLRDAARVALLRIGMPAVRFLIDAVEDERGPEFRTVVYELLADVAVLEDSTLLECTCDFLAERFPIEVRELESDDAISALAVAAARLGLRALLEPLRELVEAQGRKDDGSPLSDAYALLAENEDGRPIIPTIPPWEDRYDWLFSDEKERARVHRPESAKNLENPLADVDFTAGGRLTDSRNLPFQVPGADQALEDLEDE